MTDLAALLTVARHRIGLIAQAHHDMWQLHLGYGPGAASYEPHVAASHGVERPIPIPLDARASRYSSDHAASVRQLVNALHAAARLSWDVGDVLEAVRALPPHRPGRDHVPHPAGARIVREVGMVLIAADWRLDRLDFADHVHLRKVCRAVDEALLCLPDELYVPAPAKVAPTVTLCPGYPFHDCGLEIPWGDKRCEGCQTAAERIRSLDIDQRGQACVNPWKRRACRGDVTNRSKQLCASCDQYRRDGRRSA